MRLSLHGRPQRVGRAPATKATRDRRDRRAGPPQALRAASRFGRHCAVRTAARQIPPATASCAGFAGRLVGPAARTLLPPFAKTVDTYQ